MSSVNQMSSTDAVTAQMAAAAIDSGTQTTTGTEAAPVVDQMTQGFVRNSDDNGANLTNNIGMLPIPRHFHGTYYRRPYNQKYVERSTRDVIVLSPFIELNPNIFPQFAARQFKASTQTDDIITLCADGVDILVHRHVIQKSGMMQRAFDTKMTEGRTGIMTVEGDYKVWVIVVAAMYGSTSLPFCFYIDKPAVKIVEATVKADYILATADVKQNVWEMLTTYFSLFEYWKDVSYNFFSLVIHQNRAVEINEAWKAYKALPDHIKKPFKELGFGLIIHLYCPSQAYDYIEDLFDNDLVRIIARAAKRRFCGLPFDEATLKLFTI